MAVLLNIASGWLGANHTDRQIDALVYELCGLSDQKIALVEEATP